MNINSRLTYTITFDEIGTLAVSALERLSSKATKKERKSVFRDVKSLLPKPRVVPGHIETLETITIGCDSNGVAVVVATYAVSAFGPNREDPK